MAVPKPHIPIAMLPRKTPKDRMMYSEASGGLFKLGAAANSSCSKPVMFGNALLRMYTFNALYINGGVLAVILQKATKDSQMCAWLAEPEDL